MSRRSSRVAALAEKTEKEKELIRKVEEGADNGLTTRYDEVKGRGIETTRCFEKGSYVCTYQGELIPQKIAIARYIVFSDTELRYVSPVNSW